MADCAKAGFLNFFAAKDNNLKIYEIPVSPRYARCGFPSCLLDTAIKMLYSISYIFVGLERVLQLNC